MDTDIEEKDDIKILDELNNSIKVGDRLFRNDCRNYSFSIITILKITKDRIYYRDEINGEDDDSDRCYFDYSKLPIQYINISAEDIMNDLNKKTLSGFNNDTFTESSETAIVDLNKQLVFDAKQRAENAFRMNEMMHSILQSKMRELERFACDMKNHLDNLNRVIATIELYLGIHETIIQIKEGDKASPMSPICLRQKKLYMDEEAAILYDNPEDGIKFDSEDGFDDWVRINYKILIPEDRGIVCLGISRREKYYSEDRDYEAFLRKNNNQQYFLIRNGDNLYRVWISNYTTPRLYALKDEFSEDNMKELMDYFNKEKTLKLMQDYNNNLLAIQGIIERTEIFTPLPHAINIFERNSYDDGSIKEIRDDEPSLYGGPFPEWKEYKKQINGKIKLGTRIYFCDRFPYADGYNNWRFPHKNWNNPADGIYNIEKISNDKRLFSHDEPIFVCYHNQKDRVYHGWYGSDGSNDRKNRVSFKVQARDNILNYDEITLEAIEFYLHTRIGRDKYFEMIPILKKLKSYKLQEMKEEENFVELLKTKLGDDAEPHIREAIEWWKFKVIMKRPLMKEDAKSVRMISSRVKRILNGDHVENRDVDVND